MRFEISERIRTATPEEEILRSLQQQFGKVGQVQINNGSLKVDSIEATFGAINRSDTTVISLRHMDDGFLVIADVDYKPSWFFWLFIIISVLSYFGFSIPVLSWLFGTWWIIPIGFYLFHRGIVRRAVIDCLTRVSNEFNENSSIQSGRPVGALENTIDCPFCSERIKRNAKICRFCQRDLVPNAEERRQRCRACDHEVAAGTKHCTQCGAALLAQTTVKNEREPHVTTNDSPQSAQRLPRAYANSGNPENASIEEAGAADLASAITYNDFTTAVSLLPVREQGAYQSEFERRRRHTGLAYLYFVLLGACGAHKFYLGEPVWGTLYLCCTILDLGFAALAWFGLLSGLEQGSSIFILSYAVAIFCGCIVGIGMFFDIFLIPSQVARAGDRIRQRILASVIDRLHPKYGLSIARVPNVWSCVVSGLFITLFIGGALAWAIVDQPTMQTTAAAPETTESGEAGIKRVSSQSVAPTQRDEVNSANSNDVLSALAKLGDARTRALNSSVKANMHTVQLAVESYATDAGGFYPTSFDDGVKSYLPEGNSTIQSPSPGRAPVNPFTDEEEWPVSLPPTTADAVNQMRSARNEASSLAPGTIEYQPIIDSEGSMVSYTIRGVGDSGAFITSTNGHTMVLSNR